MSGLRLAVLVNGVPVTAEIPPESLERLREHLTVEQTRELSPFVTADEAAEILRSGRRRVYDLVADGRLPRHGDGRRLLLRRQDVERLASGALTSR